MYKLLRPVIFTQDPEWCHDRIISIGARIHDGSMMFRALRSMYRFSHPALQTSIGSIVLKNPVGLGAGFDKNARMYPVLAALGFGFVEVGSITARPCAGNPKPRLWREPERKSIRVNYGLPNEGVDLVAPRIAQERLERCALGASIAQTNAKLSEDESLQDYLCSYRALSRRADYITINISCPNVNKECYDVQNHRYLRKLLSRLDGEHHCPTFVKMGTVISDEEALRIAKVVDKHSWVEGIILTNLLKKDGEVGGRSGLPLRKESTRRTRLLHNNFPGLCIIGSGGVFSGRDALEKIEAGASAVQVVTAVIYEGPGVVQKINRELLAELRKKGYGSVQDAVGTRATDEHRI